MSHHSHNVESAKQDSGLGCPSLDEKDTLVLWSFGKSLVEFEESLYKKHRIIIGDEALSKKEFLLRLVSMERRGIVRSGRLMGLRTWSRCDHSDNDY